MNENRSNITAVKNISIRNSIESLINDWETMSERCREDIEKVCDCCDITELKTEAKIYKNCADRLQLLLNENEK